ncbi:SphA family protein [Azospirillum griseum]|uniref:Transporter n=1 Tax=Azospirillum griseum TaxID=2496639 RepID=A0A3S0HY59_9PROT|nr:transporter [Azospirillum griseum]RTR16906.1 transporter [Azospirillum griseum]
MTFRGFLTRLCAVAMGCGVAAGVAQAREPGIAPMIPPGLTMGLPIAVNPPPGVYLTNRTAFYSAKLYDNNGHYNGQKADILSNSVQLTWIPGVELLGGTYKAFVMAPYVDIHQKRTTTAVGRLGSWHTSGFGNPKIQPLDLAWNLGDGFNVSAGVGVYLPIGNWSAGSAINLGGKFWTVEPSVGVTYLKDGWNASLQILYDTNTRNPDNHYRSGDQVFANATVTKTIDEWTIGPVGYYQKQVTADSNTGGRATFGGAIFKEPEQLALGGLVGRQIGPVRFTGMVTSEVMARNTYGGTKFWLNANYKF